MASSPFRETVTRVLREAREHGDEHDVGILVEVLTLLDEGRFDELADRIARLRPIFRARIGKPPTQRPGDNDGGHERPDHPGVASS